MLRRNVIIKGYLTGLILQLAIGPVFLIILNITLESGLLHGLSALAGVVIVDYLYIFLAVFGVGRLLELPEYRKLFSVVSSIVLIIFGLMLFRKGVLSNLNVETGVRQMSPLSSFASTFILTLSNPLTIVFWTGIFANRAVEYSLEKDDMLPFGLSAGLATVSFLGVLIIILSVLKVMIPVIIMQFLNIGVGLVLIGFGLLRLIRDCRTRGEAENNCRGGE